MSIDTMGNEHAANGRFTEKQYAADAVTLSGVASSYEQCVECGAPVTVASSGVLNHVTDDFAIDFGADADHAAVAGYDVVEPDVHLNDVDTDDPEPEW